MIRKIYPMLISILLCFSSFNSNAQQKTKTKTTSKTIKVPTPQRPKGQTDVLNLTTPKMDTVRVGIIGLGMRGYSAVERYMHIPGAKITALCDIRPEMVDRAQKVIQKNIIRIFNYYQDNNYLNSIIFKNIFTFFYK